MVVALVTEALTQYHRTAAYRWESRLKKKKKKIKGTLQKKKKSNIKKGIKNDISYQYTTSFSPPSLSLRVRYLDFPILLTQPIVLVCTPFVGTTLWVSLTDNGQ